MTDQNEARATELVLVGDRYALEEPLGRGGMADVYRGVDRVLGRAVAVKVLRDVTADEADRERFMDEARTLARLSHPGLVTVLDAGLDGVQPYLVLDLVEGETLATCCSGNPLEPERVAELGGQIAEALTYVHRSGIVHRDVKPGNVLLGVDGRVKLADFGIARLIGSTTRHTRTGMTVGSPAYLSPEQVSGGDITPAVDIYSFGLVLLEALTGDRAFHGTSMEIAFARLKTPPPIPEGLSAEWQQLLASMTALDPGDRPRGVDVAAWLRRIAAGPDDPAATQLMRRRVPARRLRRPGPARPSRGLGAAARDNLGSRTAIVLAGAVAALLLLFGVTALADDDPSRSRDEVPTNVPVELEDPLRDLHEAVHGSSE